jgi:tetratricopeptide (TPR) repeat protein
MEHSAAAASRERGNALFKAGEYAKANQMYADAIKALNQLQVSEEVRESQVKCHLNRAACLLKLHGFAAAASESKCALEIDPSDAKAHYRLGQATEKLGDYTTAQKSLTDAIKLNPSFREPRELLEAVKARLKANPRLEQALQDMALVEERGLRALNYADLKRARQQMELVLKDARAHAEAHWEARALLGLALVCEDEGEGEAAQDYIDAARRKLTAADDRRAELYCLQTNALVWIDQGNPEAATPMLEGGLMLAEEMGEKGLAGRFVCNLALAHVQSGNLSRAVEYGTQAVASAKERQDRHFEAVACTALATALRRSRKYEAAAEQLKTALGYAEGLGYSHVLCAALRQFALMQLEQHGGSAEEVKKAIEKLERARTIAVANGLRRLACDEAYNKHAACVRYSHGARADAIAGLEATLKDAKELGYKRCRIDVLLALALGHMRTEGGAGWTSSVAEVEKAEAYLDVALKLADEGSASYAQVLTQRSLAHLVRAGAAPAAPASLDAAVGEGAEPETVLSLRLAERALLAGQQQVSDVAAACETATEPSVVLNLAVAMLLSERADSKQVDAEPKAAAAAAQPLLERAYALSGSDGEMRARVLLGMAGAQEALGNIREAAERLHELMTASHTARVDKEADRLRAAGDHAGALAHYKEALLLRLAKKEETETK